MISYYINILLFVIIVFIFVNDKIKEHYEKEFIKMITSRVIILLEAKEYDYLQKKLKKFLKEIHWLYWGKYVQVSISSKLKKP